MKASTLDERLKREYSGDKREEIEHEATARAALTKLSRLRSKQGLPQVDVAKLMEPYKPNG